MKCSISSPKYLKQRSKLPVTTCIKVTWNVFAIGLLLCVASHQLLFIRGEWHLQSHVIVVTHICALSILLLFGNHLLLVGSDKLRPVDTICFPIIYITSLLTSIAIY